MKVRVWVVVAGVIALAGVTTGFLFTVQVLGPHARRPRDGAGAGLGSSSLKALSRRAPET
jgi:hypothetical protein